MIRRRPNGTYYCDGRECGYPLAWQPLDAEEYGAEGLWTCLDCGHGMYAADPSKEEQRRLARCRASVLAFRVVPPVPRSTSNPVRRWLGDQRAGKTFRILCYVDGQPFWSTAWPGIGDRLQVAA